MKWTLDTALHSLRKFYCRTFWVQVHKYPGGAQTIYNVAVVLTELCDFEAFFKVTDKIYSRTTSSQKQVCAFSAFLIRFFSTTAIQGFFFFTYFFLHVWFNDLNECSPDKQHVWYVNCRVVQWLRLRVNFTILLVVVLFIHSYWHNMLKCILLYTF